VEFGARRGVAWMAVEEPLGGIIRVRFGEAVWVSLGGDTLPVIKVEGDGSDGFSRYDNFSVKLSNFLCGDLCETSC
jgi:hypothetical protein